MKLCTTSLSISKLNRFFTATKQHFFVNRTRRMVSLEIGKETMRDNFFVSSRAWNKKISESPSGFRILMGTQNIFFFQRLPRDEKLSFNISLMEHLLKRVKTFHYRPESCYRNGKSISSRIYSR